MRGPSFLTSFVCALSIGISVAACSSADDSVGGGDQAAEAGETGPKTLEYNELVTLSNLNGRRHGSVYQLCSGDFDGDSCPTLDEGTAALQTKVNLLLDTPRINNKYGAHPYKPSVEGLGPSIRVIEWNIEQGDHLDDILAMF